MEGGCGRTRDTKLRAPHLAPLDAMGALHVTCAASSCLYCTTHLAVGSSQRDEDGSGGIGVSCAGEGDGLALTCGGVLLELARAAYHIRHMGRALPRGTRKSPVLGNTRLLGSTRTAIRGPRSITVHIYRSPLVTRGYKTEKPTTHHNYFVPRAVAAAYSPTYCQKRQISTA